LGLVNLQVDAEPLDLGTSVPVDDALDCAEQGGLDRELAARP